MTALVGILLALQTQSTTPATIPSPVRTTSAVVAPAPPVLDGMDTDAVWQGAPVISEFYEARPTEGATAKQRTEGRIAYDQHNIYVFLRMYDSHPDSIISLLSRRDAQTNSDNIIVMLDSYHDKRTGYEFVVNPAGVKADYAVYSDGNEDGAWDGIWEVATKVDSLGWTAEFKIPFSQLRFSPGATNTFGVMLWRNIPRYNSQVTWPLYRQSQSGFVSQWGDLTGLANLANPRKAEFTPYLVTQNEPHFGSNGLERHQAINVGGDLKYGISSNLTLNATVNPDFGQVDADPAVLNLSAFETFFSERRPFFVEGKGLFDFNLNCFVVIDCSSGEGLFYSRRIGRSPTLSGFYGDASSPLATTIIGAAKVTGRTPGGFSLGIIDAVTDRENTAADVTLEPATNYAVVRANQDFNNGNSSFGVMGTGVNRSMDQWSSPILHRDAYAGGVDGRHRFGRFEVSGSFDLSRVGGSPEAIARTQRSSVHLYQRPDGDLAFDSTRTSLSGSYFDMRFNKVGGRLTRFEVGYSRTSPGFDVNDVGFLRQADRQTLTGWFSFNWRKPTSLYNVFRWNLNWWQYWSTAGLPTDRAFNSNIHATFHNNWSIHTGGTVAVGSTFCDRCARGGPALRQDPWIAPWGGIVGDDRKSIVPSMFVNYFRGDDGRSENLSLSPEVDFKLASRFTTSLSVNYSRNTDNTQFFGNFQDNLGNLHSTFAHLEQKELGITWRLNYTFTPTATLQLYAQPFVSKGTYSDVRELSADPRANDYNGRFIAYGDTAVTNNPGGFNFKQFRSNVVFRWEYRPGSTVFLVWSQGRQAFNPLEGTDNFRGNLNDLFRQRADDVFLVKFSYWFDW